jgi:hypothetical protein
MIDHPKYGIPEFLSLANDPVLKTNHELRFAAYTAGLYYEFAYYQMLDFSTVTNEMYEKEPAPNSPETEAYLYRAWSHAYAMYALLRTTIEAVRKINAEVLKKDVGDFYKNRIKEIVDTANDIVKHPIFNGSGSYAHRPLSLYRWGDIEIQRWMDQTSDSIQLTVSPEKDFYTIQNYLEHIASLVKKT